MKQKPFPLAWEDAIDEWQCSIGSDEKNLLKSLSQTLGAFDKDGQINSLKHVKTRFEESFQAAKSVFEKKSKPTKSLGILLSLAIYIILI